MTIKRIILEADIHSRPFKEGETLCTYARRILMEDGQPGVVVSVSTRVDIVEVSTYAYQDTTCSGERVEIEVRTEGMPR